MVNEKVRKKLIEIAKKNTIITYSQLILDCELKIDLSSPKDRNELAKILGEISVYEVKNNRPMLSAIVIEKKTPLFPAKGFFTYAKELKCQTNESDVDFFAKELTKCFEEWK